MSKISGFVGQLDNCNTFRAVREVYKGVLSTPLQTGGNWYALGTT